MFANDLMILEMHYRSHSKTGVGLRGLIYLKNASNCHSLFRGSEEEVVAGLQSRRDRRHILTPVLSFRLRSACDICLEIRLDLIIISFRRN